MLDVSLAKPQSDKKFEGVHPYGAGHPSYLPHSGYGGFGGATYGSLGPGYGVSAPFQQVLVVS